MLGDLRFGELFKAGNHDPVSVRGGGKLPTERLFTVHNCRVYFSPLIIIAIVFNIKRRPFHEAFIPNLERVQLRVF